ncbi:hypothetical protein J2Y38_003276 [Flavobacterium sp. 2755]|uniref:hypothetical protein n=1 Tax=Flavobacterium sp. 2755 TaxID=2817765 RepID=UPI002861BAAB|nr:hypothetical protein [Flavobacterium sp. 2755]MDR6763058.1 hypothetical protein [Flavobacterium sp. 2755]
MAKVIMESWRYGLQMISLTKLQHEKLGLSLLESKTNADMLLEDQIIILEIEDENIAREFLNEADRFGVNCKMIQ